MNETRHNVREERVTSSIIKATDFAAGDNEFGMRIDNETDSDLIDEVISPRATTRLHWVR